MNKFNFTKGDYKYKLLKGQKSWDMEVFKIEAGEEPKLCLFSDFPIMEDESIPNLINKAVDVLLRAKAGYTGGEDYYVK